MAWETRRDWQPYRAEEQMFVWRKDGHRIVVLSGLTLTQVEEGVSGPEEGVFLMGRDREMLQAIVDECFRAGIKPTNYDGPDLHAMAAHLDDMRSIVAVKLDVPLALSTDSAFARQTGNKTARYIKPDLT